MEAALEASVDSAVEAASEVEVAVLAEPAASGEGQSHYTGQSQADLLFHNVLSFF